MTEIVDDKTKYQPTKQRAFNYFASSWKPTVYY